MGRLVEFGLADGESVLVEVADPDGSLRTPRTPRAPTAPAPPPSTPGVPATRGLGSQAVAEHARVTFEMAVSRVQPAVQAMMGQLQDLREEPDEVQVQFGLDLHAEAGAFVAKASAAANFSVTLTWHRTATGD